MPMEKTTWGLTYSDQFSLIWFLKVMINYILSAAIFFGLLMVNPLYIGNP